MQASTILLVEDDPNSVTLFKYAWQKAKITNPLQVARDGVEALEYIEGAGPYADRLKYPVPALVLLDLRMPRATGFEVLQRIRELPGRERLLVIVFTASTSEEDVSQAYALGANAYLVKPSQLDDLVKIAASIKDFWLTYNRPPR